MSHGKLSSAAPDEFNLNSDIAGEVVPVSVTVYTKVNGISATSAIYCLLVSV